MVESGLLTKVRAKHKDLGDASMRDAHHCRAQAELCLQIAGLLSDQEAAADLRTRAAEYLTHAVELEAQLNSPCSIEEQHDRRVSFRR